MKILDRYILKSLLSFFMVTLFIFLTLILLVKLVDQMDDITKSHVSAHYVMQYLVYLIPQSLSRTVPLAMVISVLLLLLTLNLHHELIAIQASGVARSRLAFSILTIATVICVFLWEINEHIVPQTLDQAKNIKTTKIERHPTRGYVSDAQTWLRGPAGEFYSIGLVGTAAKNIHNIEIIKLNPSATRIQTDTIIQKGTWDDKEHQWNLEGIRVKVFDKDENLVVETKIPQKTMELAFTPKDFIQVVQTPDEMNSSQLRYHLDLLRQGGLDTRESQTIYFLRYASSLGPLILAIIGLAYGFVITRSEIASGIAWALLLSIFYIILGQFGVTLGKSGAIPPLLSAWIANIIIGGWGLIKLRKVLS